MSQGLALLVLRLQEESSSYYLPFVEEGEVYSHLQNNAGNVGQILLSRYFREELKQEIWGKACPWESSMGSCLPCNTM